MAARQPARRSPIKRSKAPAGSFTSRATYWLRSLPTRSPREKGYVKEMQDLTGLPQGECSNAKDGKERSWTLNRLDALATHRGLSVPQLVLEIYEVSDRRAPPKRQFEAREEVLLEYVRRLRGFTSDNPSRIQQFLLQAQMIDRMGLGAVVLEMMHELLTRGPARAWGQIAQILDRFHEADTPGEATRRARLAREYTQKVGAARSQT